MSLSKQLGLGFFFVLLFVFTVTLWMNTQNTRVFLEQQLKSHSQDTATSLGLSITPYVSDEEALPIVETMINAIFDRGYYRSIVYTNEEQQALISKLNEDITSDAPAWFVELFPLNVEPTSSQINDGWSIKGSLTVVSNTGLAYNQLWQNAFQSFVVALIAFGISLVFVWFLVKKVISLPINKVIDQAQAISQRQFEQIQEIPTTKELNRFVIAINNMSEKLFVMFKKLSNQSEEYRRFAYADFVTGVGNRRAFELALNNLLTDKNANAQGYLFLIKASSLKSIHTELGTDAGDQYLKTICQAVKEAAAAEYEHFSIFRLNGSDFGLIIENLRETNAKTMAQLIAIYTKRVERNEHVDGVAHISAAPFSCGDHFHELMQHIDSTLLTALGNESRWEISSSESVSFSNTEWKAKLENIIDKGLADFSAQAILSKNGNVLYSEWFARLYDAKSDQAVPMNQIIPASMRLDYAQALDKLIIQNVLVHAAENKERIGINISRTSLFDHSFVNWLFEKLDVYRSICPNIVIEIPERALVHDIDALVALVQRLKSYGIDICVEHFGAQLAGITHIRQIMPDFIKIDGRFTHDIHKHVDNQLFVRSLINIAQGLDIRIIIEKIETGQEHDWLLAQGVQSFQGYYFGQPKAILAKNLR